MAAPLILIVGSADPARVDYAPPLVDAGKTAAAAEQIGAELARRGCRIVVYSASTEYIEADVVRGFVTALKRDAKEMVEVRYPHTAPTSAAFAEAQSRPEVFVPTQDRNASWEAAFYASLRDADGVLIIGGGRSAHALGYMALASQVAIFPLACFGGAAKAVWLAIKNDVDLPSKEEQQLMNPPTWRDGLAPGVVKSLLDQGKRRRARAEETEAALQRRRGSERTGAAVAILAATVAITVWGFTLDEPRGPLFTWLLFFVGPLAGVGSAFASSGWRASEEKRSSVTIGGLGFVAGLIVSLFYLLAQFSTAPKPESIKGLAIIVAMASGLVAGFTMDQVLKQAAEGKLKIPGHG